MLNKAYEYFSVWRNMQYPVHSFDSVFDGECSLCTDIYNGWNRGYAKASNEKIKEINLIGGKWAAQCKLNDELEKNISRLVNDKRKLKGDLEKAEKVLRYFQGKILYTSASDEEKKLGMGSVIKVLANIADTYFEEKEKENEG